MHSGTHEPMNPRYLRQESVGSSIYSDVYRALDTVSDRVVALKITVPDELRPPHDSLCEASVLKALLPDRNPHVVELLDSWMEEDEVDELLTIVLPYLPVSLQQLIDRSRSSEGINTLSPERCIRVVDQLASALAYLHAKDIIHRDVKPANILFANTEDDCPLMLADFDISWVPPDNHTREPRETKITDVGSGTYRAPELLFGLDEYGPKLDIWPFGCIVVQLYSNQNEFPPFHNENSRVSDIALISTIFETLGVPTVETWPEVKDCESFNYMHFKADPKDYRSFKDMAPLAPIFIQDQVLPKMLCCSESNRFSAQQIQDLTHSLASL